MTNNTQKPNPKKQSHLTKPREEILYTTASTSLGSLLVASTKKGVLAILLRKNPDDLLLDLQFHFPSARLLSIPKKSHPHLAPILLHIKNPAHPLHLPLDIRGTPFQQRVYHIVQKIPLGKTSTYTDVARKIGAHRAMRAVGNTCSNNLLALAIPCHRVLRSDGTTAGTRQRLLIDREANLSL